VRTLPEKTKMWVFAALAYELGSLASNHLNESHMGSHHLAKVVLTAAEAYKGSGQLHASEEFLEALRRYVTNGTEASRINNRRLGGGHSSKGLRERRPGIHSSLRRPERDPR
jgi:hypothetical protein